MLEGLIRLDHAASREAASNTYICIQGGVGKGQAHDSIQATYRHGKWFKWQTGQDRHSRHSPAQGESL